MFGISFTELVLILVVALVVLGPQRLPGMLRTVGLWMHKLRRMTTEVRAQTGIDDLLREEGFSGGLAEVRSLLRGDPRSLLRPPHVSDPATFDPDPYGTHANLEVDATRERPVEGPDAYGALPDDLVDEAALSQSSHTATVATPAGGETPIAQPSQPPQLPAAQVEDEVIDSAQRSGTKTGEA